MVRAASASESPGGAPGFSGEEMQRRASALLSEPDRVKRTSALCDLLKRTTADNWRSALAMFAQQTMTEGRLHAEEWSLLLEQIGAVGGSAAVEQMRTSNKEWERNWAGSVLIGWAAREPAAALQWVRTQRFEGPANEQIRFLGFALAGVAQTDPGLAFDNIPDTVGMFPIIHSVVDAAIQQRGFQGAQEFLARFSERPGMRDFVKEKVFEAFSTRKIEMAAISQDPLEMLNWLDPYLGKPGCDGSDLVYSMAGLSAKIDPDAAARWLEQRSDRLSPKDLTWAIRAVGWAFYERDPARLRAWIDGHPNFPGADVMVADAMQKLLREGGKEKAAQWAANLPAPKLRETAEEVMARAKAGPQ